MRARNRAEGKRQRVRISLFTFAFCLFIFYFTYPAAAETWRILAVRVSFPVEEPDDETTSGNGAFDLRPFEEVRESYRYPFDTPPHDRAYFEAHLQALANYYREVSEGQLDIEYEVYPREPDGSYVLRKPLKEYGNGRTRREIAERITQLFRDGIAAADSAEGGGLDFTRFRAFAVFHAGLGAEAGAQAINDIPSAFIDATDLDRYAGGPVSVDGGAATVNGGMLLPEAISASGRGGLNGTLVRFFANQLGLPGLSNFEDDLPAVGDWSPLDTGGPGSIASAARLGLQSLTGDPADTILVGFVPSRLLAWSRIRLGWLSPRVVTRNDTVRIVAPHVRSGLPRAVRVPISATEYFLLENRVSRLAVQGRVPRIAFSRGNQGVWLSIDDYDAFIPGSGILIWHIDDAVIQASDAENPVNSNPRYKIAAAQYRRGISLEEADGLEDIGNVSADRVVQSGLISLDLIEGGPFDPYYVGNATVFGPQTVPNTDSNLGYPTGVTIEVLSPPGDTMAVAVTFSRQTDAWPVTGLAPNGLHAPRALDLDGDGKGEIVRSVGSGEGPTDLNEYPLSVEGIPVLLDPEHPFFFQASFTPAVGNLVTGGRGAGKTELIYAQGSTLSLWLDGELLSVAIDRTPPARVSAPPVIAPFPGAEPADIWGWSHGEVVWGTWAERFGGSSGSAGLGAGPILGMAVGNFDPGPSNELIALTESGRLFVVEGSGTFRELAVLPDPVLGGPAMADLDRDGQDEIVVLTVNGAVTILTSDGPPVQSAPVPGGAASPPVLGDLNGDGFVEVLFGGDGRLWAVQLNGVQAADTPFAFPLKDEAGPLRAPPVLADVDLDGDIDILAGSQGGLVYGLRANGTRLPGFPLAATGPVAASPLLSDLDGDGTLELVVFTENGAVHLWHLESLDPMLTGRRIAWGQLGGGPGNAARLLQDPENPPPEPASVLLPPNRVYCYPNPVRGPSANLRFFLGNSARIEVAVFNALGEIVDRLSLENPVPGMDNEISWNTSDYASGLYVCRVEAIGSDRSEVRFIKAAIIR